MNIEIKKVLDNMSILELQEVINYCQDKIELQAESEAAKLDQQIAELQAQRKKIRSRKNGNGKARRTYKLIVNPNNPDEVYPGTGPKPAWMKNGGGQ